MNRESIQNPPCKSHNIYNNVSKIRLISQVNKQNYILINKFFLIFTSISIINSFFYGANAKLTDQTVKKHKNYYKKWKKKKKIRPVRSFSVFCKNGGSLIPRSMRLLLKGSSLGMEPPLLPWAPQTTLGHFRRDASAPPAAAAAAA